MGKRIRVSNDTVIEGDMRKSAKRKRQRKMGIGIEVNFTQKNLRYLAQDAS